MSNYNTLFRIHTECSNPSHLSTIRALVSPFFDAFTVNLGQGTWRGVPEGSATIEIYANTQDRSRVEHIAGGIKFANQQDAILVTSVPATAVLI